MTDVKGMPSDLKWLAKTVHEWQGTRYVTLLNGAVVWTEKPMSGATSYVESEWLSARQQLGLEPAGEPEGVETHKQPRYQDATGDDWIDEFARTATVEEFRGAMRFTIGKYNRRMGKKDDIKKEITKMRDYCDRWLAYEEGKDEV